MTSRRQSVGLSDEVRERSLNGEHPRTGLNLGRITATGVGESQPWSVAWLRQGVWYRYAVCANDPGRAGI